MEKTAPGKKKKIALTVLIVIGTILLVYGILAIWPKGKNFKLDNPMRTETDLPILIAHGGGNREFPDNTLEAFYNAYSVDKNVMMETDVSITADGVVILSHDTTLDRKTNVTGKIADWNYSDLMAQQVNFGYTNPTEGGVLVGERKLFADDGGNNKYPVDVEYPQGVSPRHQTVYLATTLEELIVAFPENRINVEIKQSGETGKKALSAIIDLLEKYDAFDRVVVASFHEEIYDEFCALAASGEVPEEFMFSPAYAASIKFLLLHYLRLDQFFGDEMCVFQLPTEEYGISLATKSFVKAAHRNNLAVHYWTVNDPEEMRELIAIGADGIMTDYPHRLAEVYGEYTAE
ncbi:MAG: glycerophosphodiester phosphodiesterase [Ruminococcaceae bacterium]|nr:glycerophosphodiester phosphodiesterase [Oscillospiraceae bacterium]